MNNLGNPVDSVAAGGLDNSAVVLREAIVRHLVKYVVLELSEEFVVLILYFSGSLTILWTFFIALLSFLVQ